jgi:hypothetical protein
MLELNPYPGGWDFGTRTSTVKKDSGEEKDGGETETTPEGDK